MAVEVEEALPEAPRARVGRRASRRTAPRTTSVPMRHSAAHIMAEAVLDLFPGTKLGHRAGDRRRLLLRLPAARPLTPDDLAAIEERMAESIAADHPFVRRELPPDEGRAFFVERDQPFKVEILDDLARTRGGRRHADAADDRLRARPVRRPVQGPARREHRQDRPVQAARGRRRVLARRREAADAPAHLRHGLGDPGGARPVPVAARGGEEARPPSARCPARPVQLPRRLARAPPSGTRRARGSGAPSRAPCASSRPRAATRRSARRSSSSQRLWEQSGHWDLTARTCSWSSPRARPFSLKPMNCPESTFIYKSQGPLVPRPAAPPSTSTAGSTATSAPGRCRA